MVLYTLSFITVALGPDETEHAPDAELVLLDFVGIADLEVVHCFDNFGFVFRPEQLADGGCGAMKNLDELQCFYVVTTGEGELANCF